MESIRIRGILMLAVAALVLAGCSSTKKEEPPPPAPVVTKAPPPPPAPPPAPVRQKPTVKVGKIVLDEGNGLETLQGLFYFDFDQAIVRREGFAELNRHAQVLAGDRSLQVRIEGNTDERGTREYNLALGERRANAVKAYLQAQGALASQMEVISYGEEKPARDGHSEQAWSLNRRAEIVYK